MPLTNYLKKISVEQNLSTDETHAAFDCIFEGKAPAAQIAAFLSALHAKGETVDELLGAVTSMRGKMLAIDTPPGAMDIVGTGGDAHGTLNISTAVALTVAACGVPVAKHGNRAASSKSGSSDVLAALGVNLEPPLPILQKCLTEAHLCFLFAPRHHPAMRHVADVRRQLKTRTIFNLLGPLTNPANVKRHLIGVYDLEWLGPMGEVLRAVGTEVAWLTHGHDGMDEITTTAQTDVVELNNGQMKHFTLEPEHVGLPRVTLVQLKGGDAKHNAQELIKLLQGQKGSYRDIVLFNAAAALVIAQKAADLRQGIALAALALDSGDAQKVLDKVVQITNI
jgi:anthranilate phosphoribosyltransferase